MFGLFNMGEQDAWHERQKRNETAQGESNFSSLEILRILTLNLAGDGDFQQFYDPQHQYQNSLSALSRAEEKSNDEMIETQNLRHKHTEFFLQKERQFLEHLISKAESICPTIFGSK